MPEKLNDQKQIILKASKILILGIFLSAMWLIAGHFTGVYQYTSFILFVILITFGLYASLPNKVLFPIIYFLELQHCILIIVIGVRGGDFDKIAQSLMSLNFLFIDLLTTIFFICILVHRRKQIISRKRLVLEILLIIAISFVLFIIYQAIVYSGIFPKRGSILPFINYYL